MSHQRREKSSLKPNASVPSQHEGTSNKSTRSANSSPHAHPHNTEEKYALKHLHTLSHRVMGMDMRPTADMSAAILIIGLINGDACIYRTSLSYTTPVQFQLLTRFLAHTNWLNVIIFHPTKPLFVTACSIDSMAKIWSLPYIGLSLPDIQQNGATTSNVQKAHAKTG